MNKDRLRELSGQEVPYKELHDSTRELEEAVDVEGVDLFQLEKMMGAAKRGLSLANQLRGPSKREHLSRVMSNMNRIRLALKRAIDAQDEDLKVGMERGSEDEDYQRTMELKPEQLAGMRQGAKAPSV